LRDRYPDQGFALPELHFRSAGRAFPLGLIGHSQATV